MAFFKLRGRRRSLVGVAGSSVQLFCTVKSVVHLASRARNPFRRVFANGRVLAIFVLVFVCLTCLSTKAMNVFPKS